ncbi:MAG: 3-oxoacyl-[acyl-carrier-protein] reductase [Candidatus Poribacteria bacterium]|nr:3-oxoacyl-[acyl-carrier-protein] reductase [Candidatus Poribacteria bacterium]
MFSLKDKVALVTGASRGIGKAIALAYGRQGAKVMLCSRTESTLNAVADEIRAAGGEAQVFAGDVSDLSVADEAVASTVVAFGRMDILVNNAGITRDTLIIRMKDDDWANVIETNLTGPFAFTRAAAKVMMKQRYGRIINVSSVVGMMGNAGQVNYAASKAGLIGITKSLAKELGSRNVTVNAIAPGFIVTDMTDGLSDDMKAKVSSAIPLGDFGNADDIAAAACYLASDEARYVTGQTLQVDGGLLM